MQLLSIQVGLPRDLGVAESSAPGERPWRSGIFKETVTGPVAISVLGLAGDGQADLKHHGGPDKAINCYPADYFPVWQEELGLPLAAGSFGENFTTAGAREADVCIGDVFRLGTARVQVSQPRQPCWKLARRWHQPDFALRVQETGRTGWYLRVLEPGVAAAPADFVLEDRPFPQWTVAAANRIMHHAATDWDAARQFADCPALAPNWRTTLTQRAATRTIRSSATRLQGPDEISH